MIRDFGNKIASDLFHTGSSPKLPRQFWRRASQLLDIMEAADHLEDLKSKGFPPALRLHQLQGNRKGEWVIDVHKISGWRITFRFEQSEFCSVKIENYH